MSCEVVRAWCPGLTHVQRLGGQVAVGGSCGSDALFAGFVVLLAYVRGLTFFTCACVFGGFLLSFMLVSTR